MTTAQRKLVIAISSRALFRLDESHAIYEKEGVEAYREHQIEREEETLEPGDAFPLVQKLLALNQPPNEERVDVILLSRNTSDTGLRVFNSIQAHGLGITRAAFCGGESAHRYAAAFGCHLFLSTDLAVVRKALAEGVAAATLLHSPASQAAEHQLKIAFDGDAVLFSDEAERVYQRHGLAQFQQDEQKHARTPLPGGPFKPFLQALQDIQRQFPAGVDSPLRTALVTARAAPSHERIIRTLRAWDIRLDESLFLGGLEKTQFLQSFGADIFFDDQAEHCEKASSHVTTGLVPSGAMYEAAQAAKAK